MGAGEEFEISDFNQCGKRSLSFNTEETGHIPDLFLIFWFCREFFNTLIKTFQLICQLVIGRKILFQDFLIDTFWFSCPEPLQVHLCPVVFRCVIPIVVPQAESKDLLLHLFQCELMILPHPDILFDLLILLRGDMHRTVIMMGQAPGNQRSVTLVGFHFFLADRFWHCSRGKDDALHVMACKLVV